MGNTCGGPGCCFPAGAPFCTSSPTCLATPGTFYTCDDASDCGAGNVVGKDPEAVAIGDHVRAVFEEARDPRTGAVLRIPQWQVVVA